MNIGVIVKNQRIVQKDGADQKQEWLEMIVRPPFIQSCTLSVHQNKNKKSGGEPDYNLWYNFSRKGESFRGTKVGALWRKNSKNGVEYFSGHIENPLVYGGKMYVSVFKAKPMENEKAEDINWLYDVIWQPPKGGGTSNGGYDQGGYTPPVEYGGTQSGVNGSGMMSQSELEQEAQMYM
jgi:uncharacterized protein (DUF736 family)